MTSKGNPDAAGVPGRSLPVGGGWTPPSTQEFIPGGLGRRFAAKLIDLAVVVALPYILGLLIGIDALLLVGANGYDRIGTTMDSGWWAVLGSALIFLYFVAFEAAGGRTPGKRLLGLRVHGPGGAPKPTVLQAVARNAYLLLWLLPVLLNLPDVLTGVGVTLFGAVALAIAISIHRSPTNQGINDRMAGGTQVVKL